MVIAVSVVALNYMSIILQQQGDPPEVENSRLIVYFIFLVKNENRLPYDMDYISDVVFRVGVNPYAGVAVWCIVTMLNVRGEKHSRMDEKPTKVYPEMKMLITILIDYD